MGLLFWAEIALLWSSFAFLAVQATDFHPYLDQSFYFDLNAGPAPLVPPVTAQCDVLHITWSRSTATGPSPVAPYSLQVYTSAFVFPFTLPAGSGLSFDWAVPFAPGTLFQICMFDSNGNTGGCQAIFTVTPPLNTTATPSCTNVTFPLGPLSVAANVQDGQMSQYGWIPQCSDISVTPKNGTPPYVFTVAPSLHPPYNISIPSMTSTNWTVGLSWASPFFISVVDSVGNFWSNGPLHSAAGDTSCLSINSTTPTSTSSPKKTSPSVTIGAGVGGLAVGLLAGIAAAYVFMRRRTNRQASHDEFMDIGKTHSPLGSPHVAEFGAMSGSTAHYRAVPSVPLSGQLIDASIGSHPSSANTLLNTGQRGSQYQIEPFVMPGEIREERPASLHRSPSSIPDNATSIAHESNAAPSSHQQPNSQVYVVHHDGGQAPVTVYVNDGSEVVELPPRYIEGSSSSGGRRSGSDRPSDARSEGRSEGRSDGRSGSEAGRSEDIHGFLNQPRRPAQTKKPQGGSDYDNGPLT